MDLAQALLSALTAALYALALWGAGAVLARPLAAGLRLPRLAHVAVAFALGQGLYAAIWLLLALAGRFYLPWVLGLLAPAAAAAVFALRSPAPREAPAAPSEARLPAWFFLGALAAAALYGVRSFGPFLQGDALAWYVLVPREVALRGVLDISYINYAPYMSFGTEGHFAALWLLSGEAAVTLFDFILALQALAATYALGRAAGLTRHGGVMAAFILASCAGFQNSLGGGKVDLSGTGLALPAVALVIAALRGGAAPQGRVLALAGVLAGFSIVAKVSNALVAPVLAVAFAYALARDPAQRRRWLTGAVWCAAGALAALAPHFFRGWVLFGEPFVPFYLFHVNPDAPSWALNDTVQTVASEQELQAISKLDLALLPFTWTFTDRKWMDGGISPLFLALLPLGLGRRWPAVMKLTAAMAAVAIGAWLYVSPFTIQTRYFFIGLALLAVPAAWVWERLAAIPRLRLAVAVAVALTLASVFLGRGTRYAVPYVLGRMDRTAYFVNNRWLADSARVGAAVNAARAARPGRVWLTRATFYDIYFVDDDGLRSSQTAAEATAAWKSGFTPEAWRTLRDAGFRYFLVASRPSENREILDAADLAAAAAAGLRLEKIFESPDTSVYALP